MSLSMPEFGAIPRSRNGRPMQTHDRSCDARLHAEHNGSTCHDCGCCWGCLDDCCAEYACPNSECGCNLSNRTPVVHITEVTAGPGDTITLLSEFCLIGDDEWHQTYVDTGRACCVRCRTHHRHPATCAEDSP